MFSCADLWSKIDWIMDFYGPSSSIADVTCGIFMACSSNYCGGIPTVVVTALFGNKNKNTEYLHIVPQWDIFYLLASVLIRLSKYPVS